MPSTTAAIFAISLSIHVAIETGLDLFKCCEKKYFEICCNYHINLSHLKIAIIT